ncbi:MAG: cytochrome c biogenesis protein ResB [Bacteroidales bacterium]|nr:cytochrome c biogenesis protein ResB [Bacteroidales bacterium]
MPYLLLIIYLALALLIQFLTGYFPVSFMAFPLNVMVLLLWLIVMSALWKYNRKSLFIRLMLSKESTVSCIVVLVFMCLVIGLTGNRRLVQTWPFLSIILYFQTVLFFVILRGWREKTATGARLGSIRWRFLLNHVGLLVAVAAAFWGAPDSDTLRLYANIDIPVNEAYRMNGSRVRLPYEVTLDDFVVETYDNGTPALYEAVVEVNGNKMKLEVNSPYALSFKEDIYLAGYVKEDGGCILQIVCEPWKYGVLAGIIMMLAGAFLLFIGGPKKHYSNDD